MPRVFGIGFGIVTHGIFFFTVWHLFRFLHADTVVAPVGSLWIDAALAGQFAILHSVLLHPAVRNRLSRWVPRAFYGCFFCVATCLSLLAMFAGWRSAAPALWRLTGWANLAVETAFYVSWLALFYSLWLSGLGYQTGFTPWWHWVRGRALPDREFHSRSLFRVLRHPVYLSFMGLIWFNPVMTRDRLLLALVWTVYIFIGSYLKDERLAYFMGETYRRYQEQVTGYPFIPFGPLARRRRLEEAESIPLLKPAEVATRRAG